MNYIEDIEDALDDILEMPSDYRDLLSMYALLVLAVGVNCTNEHIHDAWSVWQPDPTHRSLIPFAELTEEVQELDSKYRDAVIHVAKAL